LQVLAIPLPRRPLLPGGIMPVTVQSNKLIKELFDLRKQG
jgi:Lon-like ATP-dependent protease